jgi:CRP/FNR family transcriptional regulator, polysaccharide utilization system transcription regulator
MPGKNIIDNCLDCTIKWKNFQHLTKKEMETVNANRYEATFKPGEIIIKQNSPTSSAIFLSEGLAKLYIEGIKGRDYIMSIAKPGRMIIGPGAYVNMRHTYSVAAITFVRACFINFDIFRQLVKTNGIFADSMIEDISRKSLRTHSRMVNLAHKKMPGRLAETLLYFADDIFKSDEFDMILTRQELGEMSNMAKESVVRILKEFEEAGVITSSSSGIKILDRSRIMLISEKG